MSDRVTARERAEAAWCKCYCDRLQGEDEAHHSRNYKRKCNTCVIADEIRAAEASALRRAAKHEFHVPAPECYDEAGVDWTDNHWRDWLRAEAARVEGREI